MNNRCGILVLLAICFQCAISCSPNKYISRSVNNILLKDTAIRSGHIGICIYEPASGKYWYNYNADKYFIPASNTKLFTLYTGLKYLGDSLAGIRYKVRENDVVFQPTGDPTFLHKDFKNQKVLDFLKQQKNLSQTVSEFDDFVGRGWAWDDYTEGYMAQRNDFPIYGNVLLVKKINQDSATIFPRFLCKNLRIKKPFNSGIRITKNWDNNDSITVLNGAATNIEVPFRPEFNFVQSLLQDTLKKTIQISSDKITREDFTVLYSQHVDTFFKAMMQNSDNFFAEQTLLMASNEHLGFMDDNKIIETVLRNELRSIPQKPKWVDGSGLSRYNLFTPMSFVFILEKLKNEFGLDRMKNILPTGGIGTLRSLYLTQAGNIFAKTGTLSNHVALSGYLITKNKKLLIFSVLVNNYQTAATPVRKAIEKFITDIQNRY